MKPLNERIESLTEEQAKEALKDIANHHYDLVAIVITGRSRHKSEN